MTEQDWVAVIGILGLVSLIPVMWAIVDVVRRPPWQFSTGRKVMWALVLGLGWLVLWPVALVASIVYLTTLRHRFPPRGTPPPHGGYSPHGGYPPQGGYSSHGGYPPQPPTPPLPPAGWYPDPGGSGRQRWWDGRSWTEHLR